MSTQKSSLRLGLGTWAEKYTCRLRKDAGTHQPANSRLATNPTNHPRRHLGTSVSASPINKTSEALIIIGYHRDSDGASN